MRRENMYSLRDLGLGVTFKYVALSLFVWDDKHNPKGEFAHYFSIATGVKRN